MYIYKYGNTGNQACDQSETGKGRGVTKSTLEAETQMIRKVKRRKLMLLKCGVGGE